MNTDIVVLEYACEEEIHWHDYLVIQYISGSQLTFLGHIAELRSDLMKWPQIITLASEAWKVATMHDGYIASCTPPPYSDMPIALL